MMQEGFDLRRVHEAFAEMPQFALDPRPFGRRDALAQFDAQHRRLRAARAGADQRGAVNVGVGVEHRLDLLRAQRSARGHHALRLATAEP